LLTLFSKTGKGVEGISIEKGVESGPWNSGKIFWHPLDAKREAFRS
jgi:hypothetical protein